jgi:hypothetical protein
MKGNETHLKNYKKDIKKGGWKKREKKEEKGEERVTEGEILSKYIIRLYGNRMKSLHHTINMY